MLRTRICEPLNDATPPLHHTSKAGWPQEARADDGDDWLDWLKLGPPSQNGYLTVRLPHVAGSHSARARWHRRSKEAKSGKHNKVGCILPLVELAATQWRPDWRAAECWKGRGRSNAREMLLPLPCFS
ncbi:Os01g0136502 [Oryza sativa Japonica Group]|uniref:Os01g0136502 protein n=1 Tax=Oryza sativa subsp. japonica TaxID=39947 RepID=A0A0P0UY75_ORYSJ|nr:Os01g0136502 [Oryza sativa Japonica Group]